MSVHHVTSHDYVYGIKQLERDPESRDLTAFVTHEGVFRFRTICASTPLRFQKILSTILADIPGVKCFIDDIVMFGRDKASRDKNTLLRLQDRGMTLNDKCEFDVPSMNILGCVIDEHSYSAQRRNGDWHC